MPPATSITIVPFTSFEWNRVRAIFMKRTEEDLKECVSMLTMWASRMGDTTPVAIFCSLILIESVLAELRFDQMPQSHQWSALNDIKSKHGHGITRFINYVNEMGQKQDRLLNMFTSVQEYGIPKYIVDVRHAITHKNMPDLDTLRNVSDFCIHWLWREFWQKDAPLNRLGNSRNGDDGGEEEVSIEMMREKEARACLRRFTDWRNRRRLHTDYTIDKTPELMTVYQNILVDPEGFLRTLIADGVIVMSPNQLRSHNMVTSGSEDFTIDTNVQEFWEPIFDMIFELKLGAELVLAFLWRLREKDLQLTTQHQILAYCRTIIANFAQTECILERDWTRILDCLLSVAALFQPSLIELVLSKIRSISRKRRNQVRRILNIQTVANSQMATKPKLDDADEAGAQVHTVEDLQKLLKRDRNVAEKEKLNGIDDGIEDGLDGQDNGKRIQRTDDSDGWLNVPFGLAPRQQVDNFTLVFDEHYVRSLDATPTSVDTLPTISRKRKCID